MHHIVQFATHYDDASSDVIKVPLDKVGSRYIQEAIPVKFWSHPTTGNNEEPEESGDFTKASLSAKPSANYKDSSRPLGHTRELTLFVSQLSELSRYSPTIPCTR